MKTLHLQILGPVQGVWFRESVISAILKNGATSTERPAGFSTGSPGKKMPDSKAGLSDPPKEEDWRRQH